MCVLGLPASVGETVDGLRDGGSQRIGRTPGWTNDRRSGRPRLAPIRGRPDGDGRLRDPCPAGGPARPVAERRHRYVHASGCPDQDPVRMRRRSCPCEASPYAAWVAHISEMTTANRRVGAVWSCIDAAVRGSPRFRGMDGVRRRGRGGRRLAGRACTRSPSGRQGRPSLDWGSRGREFKSPQPDSKAQLRRGAPSPEGAGVPPLQFSRGSTQTDGGDSLSAHVVPDLRRGGARRR